MHDIAFVENARRDAMDQALRYAFISRERSDGDSIMSRKDCTSVLTASIPDRERKA